MSNRTLFFVYDASAAPTPDKIHLVVAWVIDVNRTARQVSFARALCGEGPVQGSGDSAWTRADGLMGHRRVDAGLRLDTVCRSCWESLAIAL